MVMILVRDKIRDNIYCPTLSMLREALVINQDSNRRGK
jgi:hypothetical protein